MAARKPKLTPKQKRFCEEYVIDLNATQAAIRAGYSEKTSYSVGQENLKKPEIQKYLSELMLEREKRTEVTQDMVVNELRRIAFGDLRSAVTWGPRGVTIRDSAELTDDEAAAIAEVSETVTSFGGSTKIKRHDKLRALELLGKHLGMFRDKPVETNDDPLEGLVAAIERERGRRK